MNIEDIKQQQLKIFKWSQRPNNKYILDIMFSRYVNTIENLNYECRISNKELYYKFISLIFHLNIL